MDNESTFARGNDLVPNRWQFITWAIVDQDMWRHVCWLYIWDTYWESRHENEPLFLATKWYPNDRVNVIFINNCVMYFRYEIITLNAS